MVCDALGGLSGEVRVVDAQVIIEPANFGWNKLERHEAALGNELFNTLPLRILALEYGRRVAWRIGEGRAVDAQERALATCWGWGNTEQVRTLERRGGLLRLVWVRFHFHVVQRALEQWKGGEGEGDEKWTSVSEGFKYVAKVAFPNT